MLTSHKSEIHKQIEWATEQLAVLESARQDVITDMAAKVTARDVDSQQARLKANDSKEQARVQGLQKTRLFFRPTVSLKEPSK